MSSFLFTRKPNESWSMSDLISERDYCLDILRYKPEAGNRFEQDRWAGAWDTLQFIVFEIAKRNWAIDKDYCICPVCGVDGRSQKA